MVQESVYNLESQIVTAQHSIVRVPQFNKIKLKHSIHMLNTKSISRSRRRWRDFYAYVFYVFVFLFVVSDVMPYNVHYGQLVLHVCVQSQWSN